MLMRFVNTSNFLHSTATIAPFQSVVTLIQLTNAWCNTSKTHTSSVTRVVAGYWMSLRLPCMRAHITSAYFAAATLRTKTNFGNMFTHGSTTCALSTGLQRTTEKSLWARPCGLLWTQHIGVINHGRWKC
eukprot:m.314482 g.314482  ORF g.314482 m.314482 type:complete len:130 (+) comp19669_c0_seq2:2949-3338(+)